MIGGSAEGNRIFEGELAGVLCEGLSWLSVRPGAEGTIIGRRYLIFSALDRRRADVKKRNPKKRTTYAAHNRRLSVRLNVQPVLLLSFSSSAASSATIS